MIANLRSIPITDSIADDQVTWSITDGQRDELNRRLDAYTADKIKGREAAEVIADIRKRL
ncbi:addiction module protein [Crenothrix sp.]|uniref:addiction module protein n=1 Tax=Crenothrix sp. TaxID=3100433 RepID=UPI00374D77CD